MVRIGIVALSILWFTHSLSRIKELGYDFPIYYEAGKGNLVEGWVYPTFTSYFFKPFTILEVDLAFAAWYSILVLAWLSIAKRFNSFRIGGRAGFLAVVFSVYPMFLSLELGQIAPLLAWLCIFPFGSILAGLFKPYLFVFSLFHIARIYLKLRNKCNLEKGESDLSVDNFCNLGKGVATEN